jgi:hypothetical protein
MTIKKRGRPVGSKNVNVAERKKIIQDMILNVKTKPISDFQKTLNEWDAKEKQTDFKELCQKLQNALSLAYVEIDFLRQKTQLDRQSIIIEYLESRVK